MNHEKSTSFGTVTEQQYRFMASGSKPSRKLQPIQKKGCAISIDPEQKAFRGLRGVQKSAAAKARKIVDRVEVVHTRNLSSGIIPEATIARMNAETMGPTWYTQVARDIKSNVSMNDWDDETILTCEVMMESAHNHPQNHQTLRLPKGASGAIVGSSLNFIPDIPEEVSQSSHSNKAYANSMSQHSNHGHSSPTRNNTILESSSRHSQPSRSPSYSSSPKSGHSRSMHYHSPTTKVHRSPPSRFPRQEHDRPLAPGPYLDDHTILTNEVMHRVVSPPQRSPGQSRPRSKPGGLPSPPIRSPKTSPHNRPRKPTTNKQSAFYHEDGTILTNEVFSVNIPVQSYAPPKQQLESSIDYFLQMSRSTLLVPPPATPHRSTTPIQTVSGMRVPSVPEVHDDVPQFDGQYCDDDTIATREVTGSSYPVPPLPGNSLENGQTNPEKPIPRLEGQVCGGNNTVASNAVVGGDISDNVEKALEHSAACDMTDPTRGKTDPLEMSKKETTLGEGLQIREASTELSVVEEGTETDHADDPVVLEVSNVSKPPRAGGVQLMSATRNTQNDISQMTIPEEDMTTKGASASSGNFDKSMETFANTSLLGLEASESTLQTLIYNGLFESIQELVTLDGDKSTEVTKPRMTEESHGDAERDIFKAVGEINGGFSMRNIPEVEDDGPAFDCSLAEFYTDDATIATVEVMQHAQGTLSSGRIGQSSSASANEKTQRTQQLPSHIPVPHACSSCFQGYKSTRRKKRVKVTFDENCFSVLPTEDGRYDLNRKYWGDIWWSRKELETRKSNDRMMLRKEAAAKVYECECAAIYAHFGTLLEKQEKYNELGQHIRRYMTPQFRAGILNGFRGMELNGVYGRRERSERHVREVLAFSRSLKAGKPSAAVASQLDHLLSEKVAIVSTERTQVDRLFAQFLALADRLEDPTII